MKFIKGKDSFENKISLQDEKNNLNFSFGGNGDLYWTLNSKDNVYDNNIFTITKENYNIYALFAQLFIDIKEINIFNDDDVSFYFDDECERLEYLKEKAIDNELKKERYRLNNLANYNSLYNDDTKTITWYSDEAPYDEANYVTIKHVEDCFEIEFNIQHSKDGFTKDFHSKHNIPIRFSNSGSRYNDFSILFMRMYNNLGELDDVNDIGHQICVEEYLYNEKVKKLTK